MNRLIILLLAVLAVISQPALADQLPVTGGLSLWLRADAGVTVDSANHITAWSDQSGNNGALTIVGAPSLKSGAVNGHPAVEFNNGAYAKFSPIQTMSWIGVYKIDDDNPSDRSVAMLGDWDQWCNLASYHAYMYTDMYTDVDGENVSTPTPLMTDAYHLMDWRSTLSDSRGAVAVDAVAADFPSHPAGSSCNGELAELIVYNRKLSIAEMDKLQNYLAAKYSIILPHPTITLLPGRRQTMRGFGASMLCDGPGQNYNSLTPEQMAVVAKTLWKEGGLNTLRLWGPFPDQEPDPTTRDYSGFVDGYIKNGLIKDALANGVTNLLLSPGGPPSWCISANGSLDTDQQAVDYAEIIASFIDMLRTKYGVDINVTGIANECPTIAVSEWPVIVKTLRSKLDARGLTSVKITAPEWANNDDQAIARLVAIRNDPVAWAALFAPSTHSYSMPAGPGIYEDMCKGQGREFWEDEYGGDGSESQPEQGQAMAAHILNDVNFGVSDWDFFIGAHVPRSEDGMRLIMFDPSAGQNWLIIPQRYYYMQQISQAFDTGAVMRKAASSLGNMQYGHQFGINPRLSAIGGQNPDGTWSVAIVNNSGGDSDNSNPAAAETYTVDVVIPELADIPSIAMSVHRSGPGGKNNAAEGDVTMTNGKATITIGSLDLVTLRSTTAVKSVEPPAFALPSGTYAGSPPVTITYDTPGAAIHYTTDYSKPSPDSPLYTGPVTLPANASSTLQAIAVKTGLSNSVAVSASYDVGKRLFSDSFLEPDFKPAWYFDQGYWKMSGALRQVNRLAAGGAGKWAWLNSSGIAVPTDIEIKTRVRIDSWADGAAVRAGIALFKDRYGKGCDFVFRNGHAVQLVDEGAAPGPAINFPWKVGVWYWMKMQNDDGTLRAKIWADGDTEPGAWMLTWRDGGPRTGFPGLIGGSGANITASFSDFSVSAVGQIATTGAPTLTPPPGTYATPQSVKLISATDGAVVRYTLDGSEPTYASLPIYPDSSLLIGTPHALIKAKAFRAGLYDSPTVTAPYTIMQTVSKPVFTPTPGNYTAPQSIAITTATDGAMIRYTTDGSDPTVNSTPYTAPIPIRSPVAFKAKAFAPGMNDSLESAGNYDLVKIGPALFSDGIDGAWAGKGWIMPPGDGSWALHAGALQAVDTPGVYDTNKMIVAPRGVQFPADLSITARVRVDRWRSGGEGRAGVALGADTASGKGYNLIFYKDDQTIQMLDDQVAWGPKVTFPWKTGVWYRFRLMSYNGTLYARVWPDDQPEPVDWQLTWAHTGRVGFPGLNGGYTDGTAVSFEDVKVQPVTAMP